MVYNEQGAIDDLTEEMKKVDKTSEEYGYMVHNLNILLEAKAHKKESNIDWNTVLMVGGTLLQTVLILKHEKVDIICTKAMNVLMIVRG